MQEAFISVEEAIQKKRDEIAKRGSMDFGYFAGGFVGVLAGSLAVIYGSTETADNVNSDHAATIIAGVQLFMLGVLSFRESYKSTSLTNLSGKQLEKIRKTKKKKEEKFKN